MFEKLPDEILLIILNNLSIEDLYHFSQLSKKAYAFSQDKGLVKSKEIERAIKILKNYNPHDLYNEAVQNEKVAMIVVSTPELLKEFYNQNGHRSIRGGDFTNPKIDKRYEKKRQAESAYEDANFPLRRILIRHPKVAEMLFENDKIDKKIRESLKNDLAAMKTQPGRKSRRNNP